MSAANGTPSALPPLSDIPIVSSGYVGHTTLPKERRLICTLSRFAALRFNATTTTNTVIMQFPLFNSKPESFSDIEREPQEFLQEQIRNLAKRKKKKILIVLSLIAFTAVATISTFKIGQQKAATEFDNTILPASDEIKKHINSYSDILYATSALFAASEEVDRKEFGKFYSRFESHANPRAIAGLAYVEQVPESNLVHFKNDLNNEVPASRLNNEMGNHVAKTQEPFWLVKYAEPSDMSRRALGLNAKLDPIRREVFEKARDTGELAVSTVTLLLSEIARPSSVSPNSASKVLLFVLPIFKNDSEHNTREERRNSITGFICLNVYVNELLAEIGEAFEYRSGVKVDLLVDGATGSGQVTPVKNGIFSRVKDIKLPVADREWTIRFTGSETSAILAQSWRIPLMVLAVGLLFSGTITYLLFTSLADRRRLLHIVNASTEELAASNRQMADILDNVPAALFLKRGTDLRIQLWNKAMEELTAVPRHEIVGKNDSDLFPEEQAASFMETDRKVLVEGKLVAREEELTTVFYGFPIPGPSLSPPEWTMAVDTNLFW